MYAILFVKTLQVENPIENCKEKLLGKLLKALSRLATFIENYYKAQVIEKLLKELYSSMLPFTQNSIPTPDLGVYGPLFFRLTNDDQFYCDKLFL